MQVLILLFLILCNSQTGFADFSAKEITVETAQSPLGFLVPNEHRFYNFLPALKGKTGALISVGSFRSFFDAAEGDFSHALFMELSPEIQIFDSGYIEILKHSRHRLNHLSKLLGREDMESVFRDFESGRLSKEDFISQVSKVISTIRKFPYPQWLPPTDLPYGQYSYEEINKLYADFLRKVILNYYVNIQVGYLRDDVAFRKLKALADSGRMIAISGDLTGPKTMIDIGKMLRTEGINVSVIDISNAIDYFKRDATSQFVRNLQGLPLDPQARLLMTKFRSDDSKEPIYDTWDYVEVPVDGFLATASPFMGLLKEEKLFAKLYEYSFSQRLLEMPSHLKSCGRVVAPRN